MAQTSHELPLLDSWEHGAKQNSAGTSWTRICAIMVANILGTGVLSLPHAAAVLGWAPFLITLALMSVGALWSGSLYARMYQAAPTSKVLADVAGTAFGKTGRNIVSAVVYFYISGVTILFQLTSTLALQQLDTSLCLPYLAIPVAILVLLQLQIREMHHVGALAIVGSISILVPCVIVLYDILSSPPQPGTRTEIIAHDQPFTRAGAGIMDIFFAYAGQVIFIELQSDMSEPRTFPRAVYVSLIIMVVTYASVASAGYAEINSDFLKIGDPITSCVRSKTALRVVNVFLFVHVFVAYVIEGNVLARGVCWALGKPNIHKGKTREDRLKWFGITFSIVLVSYIVSNTLPFFSDLMAFMATHAIFLSYTFPVAIVLKLCKLSIAERYICYFILPFSVVVALAGSTCSVVEMLSKLKATPPFSCGTPSAAASCTA